jgi:carbon monoxide dehydrogenase subunit G
MQLEQAFTLSAPPATVWTAFQDVQLLVDCLPGASIRPGADSLVPSADIPLLFKVKLGPIAAGFAGQGQLTLDADSHSGSFSGSAVDAKTNSRVKGDARFVLTPTDAGTRVSLTVDHTVTGALAQFSREGIVRALAEQLTRQFADNLQARLPQELAAPTDARAAAPSDAPTVASPPPARPVADASSIDLWTLFKVWLRGLFAGKRS